MSEYELTKEDRRIFSKGIGVYGLIFTYNRRSPISFIIRWASWIISLFAWPPFKQEWSHVEPIITKDGDTIGARPKGIMFGHTDDYTQKKKYNVRIYKIKKEVATVTHVRRTIHRTIKTKYPYWQLVGIFFLRIWRSITKRNPQNLFGTGVDCKELGTDIMDILKLKGIDENSLVDEFEAACVKSKAFKVEYGRNVPSIIHRIGDWIKKIWKKIFSPK